MAQVQIGLAGIFSRFLFAFAIVALTWNPTRFNFLAWALVQWHAMAPLVAFSGLVLLTGWIFFVRTTAKSLGFVGVVLSLALAGAFLWILLYYDLVSTASTQLLSWIVLVLFAAILCAGMSWAHLRARWSGQATVDEVDGR
jgi:hypothetical protein